jgi:hypothetical protein
MPIPESLKSEHDTLHRDLADAVALGGRTGAAAEEAARLLRPHLRTEEELVFPPLGSLAELVAGRPAPDPTVLIWLAERLKAELPRMAEEHRAIVAALDRLAGAANAEGRSESGQLAERLKLRARTEEEVLYPAAVLVGEYLRTVDWQGVIPARWPQRLR